MTESYKELEDKKWQDSVQRSCKARMNDEWIKNTCRITDRDCHRGDCFALQVIKLAKGFL